MAHDGRNLLLEFEIIDDEFRYKERRETGAIGPASTWVYRPNDNIEIRTEAGPFSLRFVHVDPADGRPFTVPDRVSPIETLVEPAPPEGKTHPLVIESAKVSKLAEDSKKYYSVTAKIRSDQETIDAGLRTTGIKGLIAEYRYAIACKTSDKLYVDASHGGEWRC